MKPYKESMLMTTEDFVTKYQKENGKSPSLRVIAKAYPSFFGSSIAKVQRYVQELSRRGLINYGTGVGIETSPKLLSGKTKPVSLVGSCPCGNPMLAIENTEGTYSLPVEIFGADPHFMLRASGNSMINAGIEDGDFMIVREQNYADAGQIVIALIEESATAKVFLPDKDKVILRACNDTKDRDGNRVYADIVVENCVIMGVVDKVIHTPRVR
jgi:repressor LexA